jgi:primosomal protein N' (replication factor Y) (superfamily II helicase)
MRYAQVILGLPLEGHFDYSIPEEWPQDIPAGCRVRVNFRNLPATGYVVGTSAEAQVARTKPLHSLIDTSPIIPGDMLSLAKTLSEYYCCSWGEALETMLPVAIRKGRKVENLGTLQGTLLNGDTPRSGVSPEGASLNVTVIQAPFALRWKRYIDEIRLARTQGKNCLVLVPETGYASHAAALIGRELSIEPMLLLRSSRQEADQWISLLSAPPAVVVSTRSGVFAPLPGLGVIILEDEHDSAYKQDQVPHYHAREAAILRSGQLGAKLLLGSSAPSCESMYLSRTDARHYSLRSETAGKPEGKAVIKPEVRVVDMASFMSMSRNKRAIMCKFLEDTVFASLLNKEKILLFVNKSGYGTVRGCTKCGKPVLCPECDVPLVYHFQSKLLRCHHCAHTQPVPTLCPHCQTGYLRYSGVGTDKVANEVARIFPQARLRVLEASRTMPAQQEDWDITIATSTAVRLSEQTSFGQDTPAPYDLVGVLSVDNSLNREDFRSCEKTYALLTGLKELAGRKMVVQTYLPQQPCFTALSGKPETFYDNELPEREQLELPPYTHLCRISIRSSSREKAEAAAEQMQAAMGTGLPEGVTVRGLTPGSPAKLRGKYYFQLLLQGRDPQSLAGYVKLHLRQRPRSGIIVTADMDPL